MRSTIAILISSLICCTLYAQVNYVDVASVCGVRETYGLGVAGGGVSFIDFDNDGWDDLTFATEDGEPVLFFRNNLGLFEELPELAGHNDEAKQVLWVDFDNDGDKDLFIATFNGRNRLYENTGDLNLVDITTAAGLPNDDYHTFGACWGDYNRDGWLDLYYGERRGSFQQSQNRLFMNNADGTFTDVSEASKSSDPGKIPFCSAFLDYNNDKWPDIYTANDKESINTLLENNHDGTFTDKGEQANANIAIDAMCVAVGDYDNDRWQDIYVTNTSDGNAFLHNQGSTTPEDQVVFEEISDSIGTGFHGVGWGSNFLDADNDGYQDLYVSGIAQGADTVTSKFYHNDGNGAFTIPDAGFDGDESRSFSNAVGDYNNDGYPDIMVVNHFPTFNQLWRNDGNSNNWLKIKLQGVLSNRDAIGSRIEVFSGSSAQMRYTHCGIGFLGQNSLTQIIGLGMTSSADSVVVTWPSGHIDRLFEVQANQLIHLVEGETTNGEIFVDPDVEIVTSQKETVHDFSPDLSVFPNPATDYIVIRTTARVNARIVITDASGHQMYTSTRITNPMTVAVGSWLPGTYFLTMKDHNSVTAVRKWIKL